MSMTGFAARPTTEAYNRGRSVMFNPQSEGAQGHCNSVTLLGKCQGPTGIIRNDV
jgi:hypothetical protein